MAGENPYGTSNGFYELFLDLSCLFVPLVAFAVMGSSGQGCLLYRPLISALTLG